MEGKNKYHALVFRKCKAEDFSSRGVKLDDRAIQNIGGRLCPPTEFFEDDDQVKNGYGNNTERRNFQVEIHQCDNTVDSNCEANV